MIYTTSYHNILGEMRLASKDNKLIGLWFVGQETDTQGFSAKIHKQEEIQERHDEPVLSHTKIWLDRYFKGEKPKGEKLSLTEIALNPSGSEFAKLVWELLARIPYGRVCTYGVLAKEVARIMHRHKMSAQAIGGALGRNPIAILIPCHRVIGTNGSLTGYAGGIEKKVALLNHEKADLTHPYPL